MSVFFNEIMGSPLSAFRKGYICESVLIKLAEDWKALLDNRQDAWVMLLDLSKALDCLPHRLLLAKLKVYGFSDNACNIMKSYLSNRRQRVKIGESRSSWLDIVKRCTPGLSPWPDPF